MTAPHIGPRGSVDRIFVFALVVAALASACGGDPSEPPAPVNSAPSVVALFSDPVVVVQGATSVLTVVSVDDDGDVLAHAWSADRGAFEGAADGRRVVWRAPDAGGPCRVVVEVSDGDAAVRDTAILQVVSPELVIDPLYLDFGLVAVDLSLEVDVLDGALAWTASTDASWLSVSPTSGEAGAGSRSALTVSVDRTGLEPGAFTGAVLLETDLGDVAVPVRMLVEGGAALSVTPESLDFGDAATELTFSVANIGDGELAWGASADVAWLQLSPASGTVGAAADVVTATVDRTGLETGDHVGQITVAVGPYGAATVAVTLNVPESEPDPALSVTTANLYFGTSATTRTFDVRNTGGGALSWNVEESASWLTVSPGSGSTSGETDQVMVTVDRTGLAVDDYAATIDVVSSHGTARIQATMSVTSGADPLTNLFFLHNSTGRYMLEGCDARDIIADHNAANGTTFELWDQDYNYLGLTDPDGVRDTDGYTIPDDDTDPAGLHELWTTDNSGRRDIMANHEVIAFKSCYSASEIETDTELQQFKTWYLDIRDYFDQHPEKVFVVMSPPPRHHNSTNSSEAARARDFAEWLGGSAFLDGHDNIVFFDFFDLLARPADATSYPNTLRYEYEISHSGTDSHPNALANTTVGPIFVQALIDAAYALGK